MQAKTKLVLRGVGGGGGGWGVTFHWQSNLDPILHVLDILEL